MNAKQQSRGEFVWHELMTKDADAAVRFYGELFGWQFKAGDMGPVTYHSIVANEHQIGGIMATTSPMQPTAWNAYVTVDSVDAAVERATRLGGRLCVPPMDIPQTGRFAMLMDPTGGVIAPFSYSADSEESGTSKMMGQPGSFIWNELLTSDPEGCARFYSELFGWGHRTMDMGPMGTYHLFVNDGKDVAGMMQSPKEMPASAWLYYVCVQDVDASLSKAAALGAKPMFPPMDVPGVGRLTNFLDPTGAMLALFKPGENW